jgi:hypothetical protein
MRTARFQMRLPPELLAEIDETRGEVQRSVWVEGAIRLRLADPETSPPRNPASAAVAPADSPADPSVGSASPGQGKLKPEKKSEPTVPQWPRRPPPRMTGGRRTQ